MTNAKRRIGRKRWSALVAFLTETMKTSQNERVRMAAAQRLTDVLILREQREQLELRRELRDAGKAADGPQDDGQPEASDAPQESLDDRIDGFLASIGRKSPDEQ